MSHFCVTPIEIQRTFLLLNNFVNVFFPRMAAHGSTVIPCRAVKMAEKLNSNFVPKYYQNLNYIRI